MGSIASGIGNIIGGQKASQASGQGYDNANGILNDRYTGSNAQLMEGYGNAHGRYDALYPELKGNINGLYGQAAGLYSPYLGAGESASNALKGMIDSGYATHQFNLQDLYNGLSPNYDFQLGQGRGATASMANAAGGMLGGNALQGLQKYTQDYAGNAYQQAFNNYNTQRNSIFGNIQPVANMGLNAANGKAGVLMGQANALTGLGTGYANSMANLDVGQGQSQANLQWQLAQMLANNNINSGNQQAAYNMQQANAIGNTTGKMVFGF
jgi:hypothetical protein